MLQFDRMMLGRQAKELGFVRDTYEKVCRLVDVLKFMETDSLLTNNLALKGGTAINLTVFDLPRLSVDIDLDYSKDASREEMLDDRKKIKEHIQKYMLASGYILSPKSKEYHALDSMVYEYINAGGVKDNLKIEINYMLRCHILPLVRRNIELKGIGEKSGVLTVDPMEIYSAKIVALLNRAAPRDLYDTYNMQKFGLFGNDKKELFKKCIVFYTAIASEKVPKKFELNNIDRISAQKIKTDLLPVLNRAEKFDLNSAKKVVTEYLNGFLILDVNEIEFWKSFSIGKYCPELLFDGEIVSMIERHPMALWKCAKIIHDNQLS